MALPINVQRLASLAEAPFSLPASSFRYNCLTIESDQFVCAKNVAPDGSNQVVIVDLHNNNAITRRPTKKADAGLMHTKENLIVLRGKNEGAAGHFIQIFNLDTKTRLLEHHFPDDIVFWKWGSPSILAVVTLSAVWHCFLEPGKTPEKVFDRAGRLADSSVQIINYCVDSQAKWCLLAGISTQDKKVIDGHLQLYSVERQQQQFLDGHTGCFGTLVVDDSETPSSVFSFSERKDNQFKIHIMDIYSPRGVAGQKPPLKISTEFAFPSEAPLDFPIFEYISPKQGLVYLVSRGGFVIVFEAQSGCLILRQQVSKEAIFVSCGDTRRGGVVFANRKGEVISASINENTLIQYMQQNLRHLPNCSDIAISLVKRYGYPGADEVLLQLFNGAFARGDFKAAARIAATMKSGALRTYQTINQFKAAAAQQQTGQPSPVLVYFQTLLEQGSLNATESLELVRPVVAQGKREFLVKWLQEDKLECTEALGDLIKAVDVNLALNVYEKSKCGSKVLQTYVEQGQFDKIISYAKNNNYDADYTSYLRNMVVAVSTNNSEGVVSFAKELLADSLISVNKVVEIFIQKNKVQELTSLLLEYLKANKPDQGLLQTTLFELNLNSSPQVAEAIFQMNLFTHYDRLKIGRLCEKAGLYQRALDHYTDYTDIKRILSVQSSSSSSTAGGGAGGGGLNTEWLVTYLGRLPADTALECLTDMLRANRQNLQIVVQAAIKHHESIGVKRLTDMFESFQFYEGTFYFLGSILSFSTDPEVHFRYIEAATKLNHLQEVERVCRESAYYEPVQVKDFLKQAKLADPRPLIYVCDRHGYVPELAEYLYRNSLMKYIEVYVVKVNPLKAPVVIGVLIELDCSEDFIKSLLQSLRGTCPVAELVEEVEKRNRLRLLQPWLEARLAEGNQETCLHNALAMIYIDTNRDPEQFLKTNAYYDAKVVGRYCEEHDPHLAFTAYKKHWGQCDFELVELTNKNGLFRLQARYLVERQSAELWSLVLRPDNEWRQQVVEQVVASALPESTNAEEVSSTVRAFIAANLPNELMELLEKIVLHNSDFSQNKNLQNLLILTAIRSDRSRVVDYINRLEYYDAAEIAAVALADEYKMYEEAVLLYQKASMDENAMDVIINNIGALDRACEFAARCCKPGVWSKLGVAQLQQDLVVEAIDSFMKAEDPSQYQELIQRAAASEKFHELIPFLLMARKTLNVKDSLIDNELLFCLAKSDRLTEMEEFALGANTANIQAVADRLADSSHYTAAKLLYSSVPNFSKLASCHLKLGEFAQAVEAAKRATSPKTWKEVNLACVAAGDFKAAHTSGLAVVSHPDHLEEIIQNYERLGRFEELIHLLEAGSNSERAPVGLLSELGVVYTKYKPEKLSDFIRSASVAAGKVNIPKLIRACERHYQWKEAVYLYTLYKEYDQAVSLMIQHPTAWMHQDLLSFVQKITNNELLYRVVSFYLTFAPMEISNLLTAMVAKVEPSRIVQQMRKAGHLPLIQQYLEHVQFQQVNIAAVNDALNELYLEVENAEALRRSITENPNFDQMGLAKKLQSHELLQFRRLACLLYRLNHKYAEAIELSKKDGSYQDAMEAARASGSPQIAEDLLKFFANDEKKHKDCFAACLYVCYDLLRPDCVLELGWSRGLRDQTMPYMIQAFYDVTQRLDALEKKVGNVEKEKEKSAPNDYVPDYAVPSLPGMGNLVLMPPPPVAASQSTGGSLMLNSQTPNYPSRFPVAAALSNTNGTSMQAAAAVFESKLPTVAAAAAFQQPQPFGGSPTSNRIFT